MTPYSLTGRHDRTVPGAGPEYDVSEIIQSHGFTYLHDEDGGDRYGVDTDAAAVAVFAYLRANGLLKEDGAKTTAEVVRAVLDLYIGPDVERGDGSFMLLCPAHRNPETLVQDLVQDLVEAFDGDAP